MYALIYNYFNLIKIYMKIIYYTAKILMPNICKIYIRFVCLLISNRFLCAEGTMKHAKLNNARGNACS